MTRIHINASTPYDVVIENGALQRISDYIKPLKPNCRVIIVSDSNVAPHYLSSVKANMEHAGYTVCDYVFPAGESSKNAHQLIDLVEYMAAQSLTRKDLTHRAWRWCCRRYGRLCSSYLFTWYRLCTGSYIPISRSRLLCRW